jgi:prevent-host-death family protein
MSIVKATELKNNLGKYLEASIKEPIVVEKNGRKVAVIISHDLFENLREIDDAYWAMRALEAEKEGYLGIDRSLGELKSTAEGKV